MGLDSKPKILLGYGIYIAVHSRQIDQILPLGLGNFEDGSVSATRNQITVQIVWCEKDR